MYLIILENKKCYVMLCYKQYQKETSTLLLSPQEGERSTTIATTID